MGNKEKAMTLSLSHGGGETMRVSRQPTIELLVGTLDGAVRIEQSGSGWAVTGRTLPGQHVHALALEPDSGIWFAGIKKGGIQASQDDGRTWERRDVGLTQQDVYSVSVAKVNGRVRIFAGTEPAHLFVSDDLGLTWTEKPGLRQVDMAGWTFPAPPHVAHLKHISFEPGNPHTIFASIEQGGLYKSTDDGETFVELAGMYEDVHRAIIDPRDVNRMFVTGGKGLWTTTDGGKSWNNVFGRGSEFGGYPDQLVYKPSNPDHMILTAGEKSPPAWKTEGANARICRSRDGGATWEVVSGPHPHSFEAMTLEDVDGTPRIFMATTGGEIWLREIGSDKWEVIVQGLAPISKGAHYMNFVAGPH